MTSIDLKSFLPYRLSIVEQRVSRRIARHYQDSAGLSRIEWRVLATLAQQENLSASEICRFTLMDKMPVSRAISRMLAAGLLLQKNNRTDRRSSLLSLSDKGKKMYRRIVPAVLQEEQDLLSSLSVAERKVLEKVMHKLESALVE